MRGHGVIENDIVIEDIDGMATTLGFHPAKIAYFAASPLITNIPTFTKMLRARKDENSSRFIAGTLENISLFFFQKTRIPDGSDIAFLAGKTEIGSVERQSGKLSVSANWENFEAAWLPYGQSKTGSVSLGIRVDEEGALRDVERIFLSEASIQPGTKRATTVMISPEITSRGTVHIRHLV
jgi:hypothetical protein